MDKKALLQEVAKNELVNVFVDIILRRRESDVKREKAERQEKTQKAGDR